MERHRGQKAETFVISTQDDENLGRQYSWSSISRGEWVWNLLTKIWSSKWALHHYIPCPSSHQFCLVAERKDSSGWQLREQEEKKLENYIFTIIIRSDLRKTVFCIMYHSLHKVVLSLMPYFVIKIIWELSSKIIIILHIRKWKRMEAPHSRSLSKLLLEVILEPGSSRSCLTLTLPFCVLVAGQTLFCATEVNKVFELK